MASLSIALPDDNSFTPVICHTQDDLPPHVKGSTVWLQQGISSKGYYIPPELTTSNNTEPIEFINNQWHGLAYHHWTLGTHHSLTIAFINMVGLSWWIPTDPTHPNYQPSQPPLHAPSCSTFHAPQNINTSSSSGLLTASAHTAQAPDNPSQNPVAASINVNLLTLTLPAPMSVAVTRCPSSGGGSAPAGTGTASPNDSGMWGIPPIIFDGKHSHTDEFWDQFQWYKMVNRQHESMECPFDQVLTMLMYIHGSMINDWVNAQENHLVKQMDLMGWNHVLETDKVLWAEFETAFHDTWTNTSKKQTAYNQLMKLTMTRWDINNYITNFEQLALKAGWALAAEGTVNKFWNGLNKMIHSKALDRDMIPHTMDEWKVATWIEVAQAKEKYNAGLLNSQCHNNQQWPCDFRTSMLGQLSHIQTSLCQTQASSPWTSIPSM